MVVQPEVEYSLDRLDSEALSVVEFAGRRVGGLRDHLHRGDAAFEERFEGVRQELCAEPAPAHRGVDRHETDIAALYIADLVKALRANGWEIVTADTAYADPLKTAAPDVPSANGTLTELLAWEKGLPAPRWYERNNITLANRLFAERVLHEKAP